MINMYEFIYIGIQKVELKTEEQNGDYQGIGVRIMGDVGQRV